MSNAFDSLKARTEAVICNTYGRYPLAVARARDCRLWDLDGREYVDMLAGLAVCNCGHSREDIARAVAAQAVELVHLSNLFYHEKQVALAEALTARGGLGAGSKVFFCNSGAEANEAAVKLARRYMRTVQGRDAWEVVTLEGSFHGRTLGMIAATGQPKVKEYFEPLPEGFRTAPFGDIEALRNAITEQTAAVLVEVVQGEGGVRPMEPEYAKALESLCKERGVLLMVDEIQTGVGRCGAFFAFQRYGVKPHVVTTAKGMANGLPMGCLLADAETAAGFAPGSHATTFGGGGVLSAAGLEVLRILDEERLIERAEAEGAYFLNRLQGLARAFPELLDDARGMGLLVGLVFKEPAGWVWEALLERGYITNCTQERVIRFAPPLTIPRDDLDGVLAVLEELLAARKA